jgi:hypothetical protein
MRIFFFVCLFLTLGVACSPPSSPSSSKRVDEVDEKEWLDEKEWPEAPVPQRTVQPLTPAQKTFIVDCAVAGRHTYYSSALVDECTELARKLKAKKILH